MSDTRLVWKVFKGDQIFNLVSLFFFLDCSNIHRDTIYKLCKFQHQKLLPARAFVSELMMLSSPLFPDNEVEKKSCHI